MKLRILLLSSLVAMTATSMAHEFVFFGTFSGLNEVGPNNSAGTGTSMITLDMDLVTMRVQTTFSGLTGTVSASHLHIGNGPGTNGGVASQLPTFAGFPSGVTSGTYDNTFDMSQAASWNASYISANGGTATAAFNALATAMNLGKGYHNIHTSTVGSGEIRANFVPVPEPATMTVLALGLAAIARRRKSA
jgi:CHRD domain/PEP-CTERM motif